MVVRRQGKTQSAAQAAAIAPPSHSVAHARTDGERGHERGEAEGEDGLDPVLCHGPLQRAEQGALLQLRHHLGLVDFLVFGWGCERFVE